MTVDKRNGELSKHWYNHDASIGAAAIGELRE